MVWALRDIIDKFGYSRHATQNELIDKYLNDLTEILHTVIDILVFYLQTLNCFNII
jgi:hypothetical protein